MARVTVTLEDGYLHVGDTKVPLLQGEFHFWRNTKAFWPRILHSIKDLGFCHIASYVEWNFHRVSPPKTPLNGIVYDFSGETDQQRDLKGFLEMVDQDPDLWLTIRPGPYIYAETEFGGPPEEASGKYFHRLHPRFLELAGDYLKAVSGILRPHLATNGGSIVLCQLDNEVSMIKNKAQIIEGGVDELGSFANFLDDKYGDLDLVNRTYGTGWNDWEEVEPTIICTSRKDFIAFLDSCEYIEWYCQKYFEHIASIYRASGIDVPFYVNSTGGPFPHDPARLEGITCMTDLYYLGALPTMLPFNAKLLKATQPVTASAEFRCGTFGQLMTNTVYANQAMQWMAHGFHGVNYFMIVERHRWPNCPIDAVGRPGTPGRYATFKKIIGAYNRTRYPRFANGMVADVNLFWWRHHAFFMKPDPTEPYSSGTLLDPRTNFNTAFKALLEGNVGFDFYYPGAPRNVKHPCMIYAGHDYLDPGIARSLLDFALDGGTLVLYYNHPVKTVDGDPVDTFSQYIAPTRGVHLHGYHASIQVGECDRDGFPETFSTNTSLLVDLDIDANPIEGSVPYMHKHMVVGQSVPAGRGCIVQVGWDLTPSSIHGFLKSLGFKAPLRVNQDGVCCTLLQDKDEYLVGIVEREGKARQNLRINFDPDKILLDEFDLVESVFQGRKIIKKGNGISVTIPAGEGDLVWIHGRD